MIKYSPLCSTQEVHFKIQILFTPMHNVKWALSPEKNQTTEALIKGTLERQREELTAERLWQSEIVQWHGEGVGRGDGAVHFTFSQKKTAPCGNGSGSCMKLLRSMRAPLSKWYMQAMRYINVESSYGSSTGLFFFLGLFFSSHRKGNTPKPQLKWRSQGKRWN